MYIALNKGNNVFNVEDKVSAKAAPGGIVSQGIIFSFYTRILLLHTHILLVFVSGF